MRGRPLTDRRRQSALRIRARLSRSVRDQDGAPASGCAIYIEPSSGESYRTPATPTWQGRAVDQSVHRYTPRDKKISGSGRRSDSHHLTSKLSQAERRQVAESRRSGSRRKAGLIDRWFSQAGVGGLQPSSSELTGPAAQPQRAASQASPQARISFVKRSASRGEPRPLTAHQSPSCLRMAATLRCCPDRASEKARSIPEGGHESEIAVRGGSRKASPGTGIRMENGEKLLISAGRLGDLPLDGRISRPDTSWRGPPPQGSCACRVRPALLGLSTLR